MPEVASGISKETSKETFKDASKVIFGAIAISLTFGAAQFASGSDLSGPDLPADPQDRLQSAFRESLQGPSAPSDLAINRAAKADRAAGVVRSPTQSKTISLQMEGVSDTSILIRIPIAQARHGSSAPSATKSPDRKMTVACEPVVSVLTEVAKLLQPGRCVT
jgi:hypothetical protein